MSKYFFMSWPQFSSPPLLPSKKPVMKTLPPVQCWAASLLKMMRPKNLTLQKNHFPISTFLYLNTFWRTNNYNGSNFGQILFLQLFISSLVKVQFHLVVAFIWLCNAFGKGKMLCFFKVLKEKQVKKDTLTVSNII